eukprot:TRINITY_DN90700_c0_g1_i1.p1 TRINITY_DN90700_c0_g1~~TRINITY_DN90700_c0_g1_i1.p1  ORF type:complete len:328 (+),score=61.37 TRINITY_DN90700_c0_g1_i1:60-1043(+)
MGQQVGVLPPGAAGGNLGLDAVSCWSGNGKLPGGKLDGHEMVLPFACGSTDVAAPKCLEIAIPQTAPPSWDVMVNATCDALRPPSMSNCSTDCSMGSSSPTAPETNHRLLKAAREGDVDAARAALQAGAYTETRRPFGIRMLQNGPRNTGHDVGLTPLMYASQGGRLRIVQMLLDSKAEVNALEEDGLTALHFAAASNEFDIARVLVARGADVNIADDSGKAPLDILSREAAEGGDKAALRDWEDLLAKGDLREQVVGLPGREDAKGWQSAAAQAGLGQLAGDLVTLDDSPHSVGGHWSPQAPLAVASGPRKADLGQKSFGKLVRAV